VEAVEDCVMTHEQTGTHTPTLAEIRDLVSLPSNGSVYFDHVPVLLAHIDALLAQRDALREALERHLARFIGLDRDADDQARAALKVTP
jgi:hypothetical protein